MVATIAQQPFSVAKIPVSSWTFTIRIWLATIVALFVSFWLQLEAPSTAALTLAILAEPTRGQALEKAGFRLIATIVGVTASIAITGLCSQARDLMLAAFSVWLGICVFAAKRAVPRSAERVSADAPSRRDPQRGRDINVVKEKRQ